MFAQYFGQYLLNKGYVTAKQLQDALEYQKTVRLKLGVLAVSAGYMTADDADRINEAQKREDIRFGDLAVKMGLLKNEQVEELLSSQKQGHVLLGQALVDKEYMTLKDFESYLNQYKNEYGITDEKFKAIQKDDIDEIINMIVNFTESKNEKELKAYLSLFIRNLFRFIDVDARVRKVIKSEQYEAKNVVKQEIVGELALETFIEAEEDSFVKFASKFAEEELTEIDEMAQASVGELLNLHNGIFLVNMSNMGTPLELNPQEAYSNIKINNIYIIPIDLSFGKINLIIKENK